jgi:hypothetical protein
MQFHSPKSLRPSVTPSCLSWVVALALSGLATLPALAVPTNLTWKAEATVKETFDSNVYLQDHEPSPAVTNAARPFQESLVTSITPRLALDYKPWPEFGATISYAPEIVFYHSAPSEDYVTHRGTINLGGKIKEVAWEQPNSATWIDGNDSCLFFGGPGGAPAIGGIPIRDRRAAFIYRSGFKATIPVGNWFVRPAASAYVHDFLTKQLDSRLPQFKGYENYVDRNDVSGGLDLGRTIANNTRVFVGYRFGHQDEGSLVTEPGVEYDNQYHRVLFGIEGQPVKWLKLNIALGPDFHHSTATTATNFAGDYVVLFIDSTVSLLPTDKDTIALTVKQFTQPAFASCSIYQDTTYDIAWRHKFDARWSAACGFRAYVGDWRSPVRREDWIYTPSATVTCTVNPHVTCEASYSYDWVDSKVPGTEGREFTRHLVSLSVKYMF